VNPSRDQRFRCPGENYWIDRATHLARLAAGFAPCRSCEARGETGGLVDVKALADDAVANETISRPAGTGCQAATSCESPAIVLKGKAVWTAEGLAGTAENEIDAALTRRMAMALGTVLSRLPDAGSPVRVAVGGDGRWLTAPLVAAASQGCQLAGCRVIELGGATGGTLVRVIRRCGLDGGILIGNSPAAAQTVSLRCFGPEARPWSTGGGLEPVRQALTDQPVRTSRRSGGLERTDPTGEYRDSLADLFHGLRPLRFVLDAASRPLGEHLHALARHSACEILLPAQSAGSSASPSAAGAVPRPRTAAGQRPTGKAAVPKRFQPIDRLRTQVAATGADFGVWIDGDADRLVLIDERGRQIGPERLLWALAKHVAPTGEGPIVLASDVAASGRQLWTSLGGRVIEADATCEAVDAALRDAGAAAGVGPGDRLWFAGDGPTSDALASLGLVLQMLSRVDRPLSELLD